MGVYYINLCRARVEPSLQQQKRQHDYSPFVLLIFVLVDKEKYLTTRRVNSKDKLNCVFIVVV